ncbi:Rds1 [Fusarium sp. NRRL 52700]|nr:Rds1 [Fusarium sp. NRRL 52700]
MSATSFLRSAMLLAAVGAVSAVPVVSEAQTTVSSSGPAGTPRPYSFVTSHGPFKGTPTTTGALSTTVLASAIPQRPPPPGSFDYPANGKLNAPQPAPYTPDGGVGTNGSAPVYRVQSDFDYQSLALALYQEWIELDLFRWGLATFSKEEFDAYGINDEDRFLIEHMARQEIGHATVISNMLGPEAPKQCTYNYPVSNVPEFIDFNQKLTRWGESGVYGFLPHLNSGPAAQLLLQSITIEARQQMIFRQFGELGVDVVGANFPSLNILNQPNPARINGSAVLNETTGGYANTLSTKDIDDDELCVNATKTGENCKAAITHNRTIPLSYPGRQVFLNWDAPGKPVGPNNSYITSTNVKEPKFAAWVSQLNVTYSPLQNISLEDRTAYTIQPNVSTWQGDPAINGTMFLALTDTDLYVTPYNLTMINPHVAALAVYQAG